MSALEDIYRERASKYERLTKEGVNPFPAESNRDLTLKDAVISFSKNSKSRKSFAVAGRVMALRLHGGSLFFNIQDGTADFQCYLKKDAVGEKDFSFFNEMVDAGDFLECFGRFFLTKKKEKTLEVKKWKILSKSLRPLPEKWHGLQDVEERFRKRYLDILMNKEAKERFVLKSRLVLELRNFLQKEGFLEVETPMLHPVAGGAIAKPFKTHHNALDIDLFLRVAPELYLKKLLIGGFNKIYEIGRSFRNEGMDATHNPEFTMLELYETYRDAAYLRSFVEKMLRFLIKKIFKSRNINYEGKEINFQKPFSKIAFSEVLKKYALIVDSETISKEDLILKARQFGIEIESFESRGKIMDNIFKKICRPRIVQPTFVVGYPLEISPLAKTLPGGALADRFQLIAAGFELVNGFSELNDPVKQKENFIAQAEIKKGGDEEALSYDKDYIEAMEYGMPPAAGVGIGIDRLAMLFADVHNIKEVILFPTMRPR